LAINVQEGANTQCPTIYIDNYENQMKTKTERKKELVKDKIELKKKISGKANATAKKKIQKANEEIENLESTINSLKTDLQNVKETFKTYYKTDKLKDDYYERTDHNLINHFKSGLLKQYKSDDILLRKTEVHTILDAIRMEVVWE